MISRIKNLKRVVLKTSFFKQTPLIKMQKNSTLNTKAKKGCCKNKYKTNPVNKNAKLKPWRKCICRVLL
jgi:hypothetical protein